MTAPGYSGKPLVLKLGIKPGMRVGLRHAPEGFLQLLEPWPEGASVTTPAHGSLDAAVLFAERAGLLEQEFAPAAAALTQSGMLWVAWPKRSSGVATDLTEDRVREIGLAAGLVDVKVCAMTNVWSGLKFVRRLADRRED